MTDSSGVDHNHPSPARWWRRLLRRSPDAILDGNDDDCDPASFDLAGWDRPAETFTDDEIADLLR